MAAIYEAEMEWNHGEEEMHKLLKVPHRDNPTSPFLSPYASSLLMRSPLVALGTLDAEGKPWTSLWGGERGFSKAIAQSIIGVKTTVEKTYDPVVETLFGGKTNGEVIQEQGRGRMVGGLAIDLETRSRVKLYGRMVAGALAGTVEGVGEVQLVVRIEQSLGNCPKYLNRKHIVPHVPQPKLVTTTWPLPQSAVDVIEKADLFFISSSDHDKDMDTNHRGGPQGFVRILSNDKNGLTLVYPEYSGNRLYQTLGNLKETPYAGLVFPDFETGDVLYVTGKTEILAGEDASALIAHTNLAIKIHVEALRFVARGLGFRGHLGERSPYNPPVRYLSTENRLALTGTGSAIHAKLLDRQILAPSIARFRFSITNSSKSNHWKPGQYVALSFQDELDIGYSHMRDDDPKSLNDDFLRTFTVSSRDEGKDEFEITVRKVGPVTEHLFRHNMRYDLEVPLQGFGGEFYVQQDDKEHVAFVAGGVGITPLLAQAQDLDLKRLQLYWTVRAEDLGLVANIFDRILGLATSTKLFITGAKIPKLEHWEKVEKSGASVQKRRMVKDDIAGDASSRWYLCTGPAFRNSVLGWLEGKTVLYEDFNY